MSNEQWELGEASGRVKKTKGGVLLSLVFLHQETSLAFRNSLATVDIVSLGKHPLVGGGADPSFVY